MSLIKIINCVLIYFKTFLWTFTIPADAITVENEKCDNLVSCWKALSEGSLPEEKIILSLGDHMVENFTLATDQQSLHLMSETCCANIQIKGNTKFLVKKGSFLKISEVIFRINITQQNFIELEQNSSIELGNITISECECKVTNENLIIIGDLGKFFGAHIMISNFSWQCGGLINISKTGEVYVQGLFISNINFREDIKLFEGRGEAVLNLSEINLKQVDGSDNIVLLTGFNGTLLFNAIIIEDCNFSKNFNLTTVTGKDENYLDKIIISNLTLRKCLKIKTLLYISNIEIGNLFISEWAIENSSFEEGGDLISLPSGKVLSLTVENFIILENAFSKNFITFHGSNLIINKFLFCKNTLTGEYAIFKILNLNNELSCRPGFEFIYFNFENNYIHNGILVNISIANTENQYQGIFFEGSFGFNQGLKSFKNIYHSMLLTLTDKSSQYLLNNIKFINNSMTGGNPCAVIISINTNVTFHSTLFFQNMGLEFSNTVGSFGANIYFINVSLIENIGNQSQNMPTSGIMFEGPCTMFKWCRVINNTANFGNFLHVALSYKFNSTFIIILNSEFDSNKGNRSSIIMFELKNLFFFMTKTVVKHAICTFSGSFLYVSSVNRINYYLVWKDSIFFNNTAQVGGGVLKMIYNHIQHFLIFNCTFENNTAFRSGGVILFWTLKKTFLYTISCTFRFNKANEGGAIADWMGNVEDQGSHFEGNCAEHAATYYVSSYSEINLTNTIILKARANSSYNILIVSIAKLFAYNITIIGCQSNLYNSAIAAFKHAKVFVNNSKFLYNNASIGALYRSTYSSRQIIFNNSEFLNNSVSSSLFFTNSANLLINNCSFINNEGRLFVLLGSIWTGKSVQVKKNICPRGKPGCVINAKENSQIKLEKFLMEDFTIFDRSSLVELSNSYLELNSGFLRENERNFTGAIFFKITHSEASFDSIDARASSEIFLYAIQSNLSMYKSSITKDINSKNSISACNIYNSLINFTQVSISEFSNGAMKIENNFEQLNEFSLIKDSLFNNNTGTTGAGLLLLGLSSLKILINNSRFVGNYAEDGGGAVYSDCGNSGCNITFKNSNFENNFVEKSLNIDNFKVGKGAGGAIFWTGTPVNIENCKFTNNSALYGNDFATPTVFMHMESQEVLADLEKYVPGMRIPFLKFSFRDFYNETVVTINNKLVFISLNSSNISQLKGLPQTTILAGLFQFEHLTVLSSIGSTVTLRLDSEAIKIQPFCNLLEKIDWSTTTGSLKHVSKGNKYGLEFNITISTCIRGQIYDQSQHICINCTPGFYSFSNQDEMCEPCPAHAHCSGGDHISVEPGYWRISENSSKIYLCPKSDACPGGENISLCSFGYEDFLCNSCYKRNNKKGYYFVDLDRNCKLCGGYEFYRSLVILLVIFFLLCFYMIFLIRFELSNTDTTSTLLLKIMNHHVQVTFLTVNLKLDMIDDIRNVFKLQKGIDNPSVLFKGIECFLNSFLVDINIFFKKSLFGGLLSLLFPLSIIVFWHMYYKLFKKKQSRSKSNYLFRRISTSLIIMFYMFQPSLINQFFESLTCKEIANKFYISSFISQECWVPTHLYLVYTFTIPLLVIWMVIVPAFINLTLYSRLRRGLEVDSYSYALMGYKTSFFYWDLILFIEKYILIFSSALINEEILVVFIFYVVSLFYLGLQAKFKPLKESTYNRLVFKSYLSLFLFVLVVLVSTTSDNKIWVYIFLLAALISSTIYFYSWIKLFISSYKIVQLIKKFILKNFYKEKSKLAETQAERRIRKIKTFVAKTTVIDSNYLNWYE